LTPGWVKEGRQKRETRMRVVWTGNKKGGGKGKSKVHKKKKIWLGGKRNWQKREGNT